MVPLDLPEKWVLLESLVDPDYLVYLVQRETLVAMDLREALVCRDPEENQENLGCQENLDF